MTKNDLRTYHRRSIRLKGYDYAADGCYFVTICVRGGGCVLGKVVDGEVVLSEYGRVAEESWLWLEEQYRFVTLDAYVIMPNHMHGIVVYGDLDGADGGGGADDGDYASNWGGSRAAATEGNRRKTLGRLVGAYKTVTTKQINVFREAQGAPFWQRNFWEHIVRNERALLAIRDYIRTNPARWEADQLHPDAEPNPFKDWWERP